MMLLLLYMDTARHTQMHSRHTVTQTYTPPTMTQTDTQTHGNTQADTYKPTQRHIKTCIASQRHTSTHRDTYKHTYKQTHKHMDTQTTHGFIIPRPSEPGSDQGPKRHREVCAAGRGLHPLPFEVGSRVRGLYSVVDRGSGRISPA